MLGVMLLGFVALAEGALRWMIKLAVDFVLNLAATSSQLPLARFPGAAGSSTQRFLSPHIRHVWTVIRHFPGHSLFLQSARRESRTTQIQYSGLSAVTDLRNQVYARVIRQPIVFPAPPTGRLISTVINDVERVRYALSEWMPISSQNLYAARICRRSVWHQLENGAGLRFAASAHRLPVNKFRRKIRRSAENSQTRLADLSQILQETSAAIAL